mgnify:FL=1
MSEPDIAEVGGATAAAGVNAVGASTAQFPKSSLSWARIAGGLSPLLDMLAFDIWLLALVLSVPLKSAKRAASLGVHDLSLIHI